MNQTTRMLREYTELMNSVGPDSQEAAEYLEARRFDSDFVELADLARKLKKALTAPVSRRRACV